MGRGHTYGAAEESFRRSLSGLDPLEVLDSEFLRIYFEMRNIAPARPIQSELATLLLMQWESEWRSANPIEASYLDSILAKQAALDSGVVHEVSLAEFARMEHEVRDGIYAQYNLQLLAHQVLRSKKFLEARAIAVPKEIEGFIRDFEGS